MAEGWPKKRRILGTKVKRLDGPDKATGRAKYSYDVNRPGMLHGAILRSPHAHAKIKSLDTVAAGKKKGDKKQETFTVRVTPAVTLASKNKVVTLADLKPGDPVTVESERD